MKHVTALVGLMICSMAIGAQQPTSELTPLEFAECNIAYDWYWAEKECMVIESND